MALGRRIIPPAIFLSVSREKDLEGMFFWKKPLMQWEKTLYFFMRGRRNSGIREDNIRNIPGNFPELQTERIEFIDEAQK